MKVIAGLGNPGREYEATRHNLGYMLIDRLLDQAHGRGYRRQYQSQVAEVKLEGHKVLLVKPETFMNLSGDAVAPLLAAYGDGDAANLIVACDDVALPFGMIRIRKRGSAGGQKGLQSIIDRLGTQEFTRVRMGIKPDHPVADLRGFVLTRIRRGDRTRLEAALDRAAEAIVVILTAGVDRAMALFNERVKFEEGDRPS